MAEIQNKEQQNYVQYKELCLNTDKQHNIKH